MNITAKQVKDLRDATGVSMMECKKALVEAGGDEEKAKEILRKKGIAKADKRSGKETGEGYVGSYVHTTGKLAAMVALSCETDFVARSDDFRNLANEIAMQVAAMNPKYISPDDADESELDKEKDIIAEQLKKEGKPDNIVEKIMEGKIKKFKEEGALLKQKSVKNSELTIEEVIKEGITKMGENITVKRIERIEM